MSDDVTLDQIAEKMMGEFDAVKPHDRIEVVVVLQDKDGMIASIGTPAGRRRGEEILDVVDGLSLDSMAKRAMRRSRRSFWRRAILDGIVFFFGVLNLAIYVWDGGLWNLAAGGLCLGLFIHLAREESKTKKWKRKP